MCIETRKSVQEVITQHISKDNKWTAVSLSQVLQDFDSKVKSDWEDLRIELIQTQYEFQDTADIVDAIEESIDWVQEVLHKEFGDKRWSTC